MRDLGMVIIHGDAWSCGLYIVSFICTEGGHTAPPAIVVSLAPPAPIASTVALHMRSAEVVASYTRTLAGAALRNTPVRVHCNPSLRASRARAGSHGTNFPTATVPLWAPSAHTPFSLTRSASSWMWYPSETTWSKCNSSVSVHSACPHNCTCVAGRHQGEPCGHS